VSHSASASAPLPEIPVAVPASSPKAAASSESKSLEPVSAAPALSPVTVPEHAEPATAKPEAAEPEAAEQAAEKSLAVHEELSSATEAIPSSPEEVESSYVSIDATDSVSEMEPCIVKHATAAIALQVCIKCRAGNVLRKVSLTKENLTLEKLIKWVSTVHG